jgi:hypothetical protein
LQYHPCCTATAASDVLYIFGMDDYTDGYGSMRWLHRVDLVNGSYKIQQDIEKGVDIYQEMEKERRDPSASSG